MIQNTSKVSRSEIEQTFSYREDFPAKNSALLKTSLDGPHQEEQDLTSSVRLLSLRGSLDESFPIDILEEAVNQTLVNVSSYNESGVTEGVVKTLPQEMLFNTS
ncbi:hypothetical protein OTU49_009047, partial [Cherax quadricarinatus]